MSRNAVFGAENPPVVIEHGEKRYSFSTAITFAAISEIETALYQKALKRVIDLRDAYPPEAYVERLDACRMGLEEGKFDLVKNEAVRDHLKSASGVCLLMSVLGKCSEAEILTLMEDRRAELEQVVQLAVERSLSAKPAPEKTDEKKAPAA